MNGYRHPSAVVEDGAIIAPDVRLWHDVHVREGASIGEGTSVGKGAYIDKLAIVGAHCKIQNYACIYQGVTLADYVFVGPHACFTNDRYPRAVGDWTVTETHVHAHASIGANATIVCGVSIGKYAMVGCGAVVTHDVPAYARVIGNPARLVGFVCPCGAPLQRHTADCYTVGYCYRCQNSLSGLPWNEVRQ